MCAVAAAGVRGAKELRLAGQNMVPVSKEDDPEQRYQSSGDCAYRPPTGRQRIDQRIVCCGLLREHATVMSTPMHQTVDMPGWNVGWGVARSCNMGCRFCYSRIAHDASSSPKGANLAPYLQFVRDNALELATINWGTTENTTAGEWYELVSAIQGIAPHVVQAVTTNGYLARACRADVGREEVFVRCVREVDVSLDFCSPERHNLFRGHPEAFAMALETLEFCRRHSVPRSLVMLACGETLFPENLDGLFRIAAHYDAHVRLSILRPVRGCQLAPLDYGQLRAGLRWITERHDAVSLSDPLFAALAGCPTSDPAGLRSARILPNGDVTPCTYLIEPPWVAANIYRERVQLNEIGSRWAFRALREPVQPEPCRECTLWSACGGGAKDRRILAGGSLATRDPYCPRLHDDGLHWFSGRTAHMKESSAPLVHAAYLSTLIFAHGAGNN